MTVKVDLAEFLTAYIAEVDEHLASATSMVLAIDAAARKGERQPRAVRDLFRAMHTIKGLSAMVGVEAVVTVAHRIETILREVDRSGGAVPSEVADLLLRGIRAIEQCVRAVEKGSPAPAPPQTILEALDAVVPQEPPSRPGGSVRLTLDPAVAQKLDAFELDLLLKGAEEGRRAVRLDYVPTPTRVAQGLNINTVRERVSALGELVRVVPFSLSSPEGPSGGIAFALLVLTSRSDDDLAAAAGVDPRSIRSICERDEPAQAATSLTPHPDTDELPRDLELGPGEGPRRNILRVDVGRVDQAMEQLGTLVVTRSRLAREIARLAASGSDTRELVQIAHENARQLRDLRSSILQVRMVPVREILDRLPLMMRALTRTSGKKVRLETEVGGAELDKAVAERIFPAIIHLVRNAVDHGIEPPEARASAGKPVEGTIRIECSARSSARLELSVRDDGRGVDAPAVARRVGVAVPSSDAGLLELLCQPGLSTRDEATTTSGRGLGMDIVKRTVVDQLGGVLSMETSRGVGTTFLLQIPLTVAIVDAFVVECAGMTFAVPVASVEEILEVDPAALVPPPYAAGRATTVRAAGMIPRRRETLPLYSLRSLLGVAGAGGSERRALVIRRGGEPLGLLLDRVTGQQEAVIRPLVDPLVRVPGISASTDLGDGRPTLVLDLVVLAGKTDLGPHAASPAISSGGVAGLPGQAAIPSLGGTP